MSFLRLLFIKFSLQNGNKSVFFVTLKDSLIKLTKKTPKGISNLVLRSPYEIVLSFFFSRRYARFLCVERVVLYGFIGIPKVPMNGLIDVV